MPRTATGKVDRTGLKRMAESALDAARGLTLFSRKISNRERCPTLGYVRGYSRRLLSSSGVVDDPQIHGTIERLVEEEHALWQRESDGTANDGDRQRLEGSSRSRSTSAGTCCASDVRSARRVAIPTTLRRVGPTSSRATSNSERRVTARAGIETQLGAVSVEATEAGVSRVRLPGDRGSPAAPAEKGRPPSTH